MMTAKLNKQVYYKVMASERLPLLKRLETPFSAALTAARNNEEINTSAHAVRLKQ